MSERKQETFKVTDRRLFTTDGESRESTSEESSTTSPAAVEPAGPPPPVATQSALAQEPAMPPPPTVAEQQQQADAYQKSSRDLDARVELSGHSSRDLQMTFERFLASLYMSAMLQLGLMREEGGQPHIDLIGARQTIDTMSLLSEKTKGNLTPAEENFLQNSLYELRMAYVEVTNALARPPQAADANPAKR
jgi:Domain of unknown function (DUF1844)